MAEIKIQDSFEHNCDDCQGLCCVAFEIKQDQHFPEHKAEGAPCHLLNLDPQDQAGLCKCKVFNVLAEQGRGLCIGYTCQGAGNAITKFLRELGIHWTMKPDNMDEQKWELMRHNINNAFLVLEHVFYHLYQQHPANNPARQPNKKAMYEAQKKAARKVANELAAALENSSEKILVDDWYENKFKPAMREAAHDVHNEYLLSKLGGQKWW